MKRVGNLSSAAGLIFFGVWMIMDKVNSELAKEVFKWWPAVFIIIGLEILIYFGSKNNLKKVGFNPLIIFIILLFICVNIFIGIKDNIANIISGNYRININGLNIFDDIDKTYKKLDVSKTINFNGNKIVLSTDNGDIQIKKSTNKDIRIEGKVFVDNGANDYQINEIKNNNECNININDSFIKGASIILYVPDNYEIRVNSNNLKFDSSDENLNTSIFIQANNGTVNLKGNVENMGITLDNGTVNVSNKLSKAVDIKINNGTVNLNTSDKNVNIKASIDGGVCSVNKEKRVNAGINQINGTGEDKININANHGLVTIHSQE